MFKTLLKQAPIPESPEPREGDLYRRIELFGKIFELRYGYYEEKDRRGVPDVIYPNFIKEPTYTDDGRRFVTMMQDACGHFAGSINAAADSTCGECQYFRHGEAWLGVCTCSQNDLRE